MSPEQRQRMSEAWAGVLRACQARVAAYLVTGDPRDLDMLREALDKWRQECEGTEAIIELDRLLRQQASGGRDEVVQ